MNNHNKFFIYFLLALTLILSGSLIYLDYKMAYQKSNMITNSKQENSEITSKQTRIVKYVSEDGRKIKILVEMVQTDNGWKLTNMRVAQ